MSDFKELVLKPHFNIIRILFSVEIMPFLIIGLSILAPLFITAPLFSIFVLIIGILITEFAIFMNYRATLYKIDKEKIEFNEGFINHQTTSIKIKNIKEVHLTQSFIQRIFKLGTIRILTAGSNTENGGGLKIKDIDSSASLYTFLNRHINSVLNLNKSLSQTKDKAYVIKPDYKSHYYTFLSIITAIFIVFIFSFIPAFIIIANDSPGLPVLLGISFACIILLAVLFIVIYRLEYKNRKYLVSSTKIESKEGFFNYHYTTIILKNIKEIRLERGFFQRKFGLGSVIITTPSNNLACGQKVDASNILLVLYGPKKNNQMNYYKSGINITNVKDSIKIYKWLKALNDNAISENARNIANDKPQYTYKPTFNVFTQIIDSFCFSILLFILSIFIIFPSFMCEIPVGIVVSCVTILLCIFFPIYLAKKNYDCSKYEIYPTRIEFHEGFIKNKSSMVLIENIKEIHVEENFIQKLFKLSTIKIITSGTTNAISSNDSGEIFRNLKNGQEVYEILKQLINSKKESASAEIRNIDDNTVVEVEQNSPVVNEVEEQKENIQKEKITAQITKMTFNPKFNLFNIFLNQFFIIFGVMIFILLSLIFVVLSGVSEQKTITEDTIVGMIVISIMSIIAIITLSIIISVVISIFDGLNYKATKYEFLEDKINFTEGFFNNNYTSLEYKNIREISLIQSLSQRIFKLGTIKIETAAGTSFSGLKLRDIKNSSEIYNILENNIKAYSKYAGKESSLIKEFKPKYNIIYAFFCYAIPTAFLTLIMFGFIVSFFAFFISFIVMAIKHNCQKYKIYSDKTESVFSFINKHSCIIFNEKLREIHLKKGFMQRIFGIGTFTLITAASGGHGCKLFNVSDVDNINTILKEIEKNNEE